MRRLSTLSLIMAILFASFLSVSHPTPARASQPWSGTIWTTFAVDTNSCDVDPTNWQWTLSGGNGTYLNTVSDVVTVTDGAGATLYSQDYGPESGGPIGGTGIGGYFSVLPTKNPITIIDYLDGVFFLTYQVDVPCFPPSQASSTSGSLFTDQRINPEDAGQTVTGYCQANGTLNVYNIDSAGKGYFAFSVTVAEIASVPKKPAVNTAIKSGKGATLYRLTSGELQVNRAEEKTGKMYAYRFADCLSDSKAPIRVECVGDGSIKVIFVDIVANKETLAFTVTPAENAKVPAKPAVNTLIKQVGNTALWRLSGGDLQINRPDDSGSMITYHFGACSP